MPTLLHLSDLHLVINPARERRDLFDMLVQAIAALREDEPFHAIAVTGDVCDSSTMPVEQAAWVFATLLEDIQKACKGPLPAFVLPGNHDRRGSGIFGPQSPELFLELRRQLAGKAEVHGCESPFLARLLPAATSGLGLDVVLYDSTWLPRGKLSAGGLVQQEDLLAIAAQLPPATPESGPLLLLLHHHLIPTSLTDLGMIELEGQNRLVKYLVQGLLPRLVAHGDREELTMTALGTGTALSTLQSLGRAVLVLHGHKHYPTPRLLRAVESQQGDVLIASAGGAGVEERWRPAAAASRLWPSFNLVAVDQDGVEVRTVAFSPREAGRRAIRTLASAQRRGAHWEVTPVAPRKPTSAATFALNEARFALRQQPYERDRWDVLVERLVTAAPGATVDDNDLKEPIEGARGALALRDGQRLKPGAYLIVRPGIITSYQLRGGAFRTVEAQADAEVEKAPFGSVALHVRKATQSARLILQKKADLQLAFGSVTDLTTGLESHARLTSIGGGALLEVSDAPAQSLLRIYWPLERA